MKVCDRQWQSMAVLLKLRLTVLTRMPDENVVISKVRYNHINIAVVKEQSSSMCVYTYSRLYHDTAIFASRIKSRN